MSVEIQTCDKKRSHFTPKIKQPPTLVCATCVMRYGAHKWYFNVPLRIGRHYTRKSCVYTNRSLLASTHLRVHYAYMSVHTHPCVLSEYMCFNCVYGICRQKMHTPVGAYSNSCGRVLKHAVVGEYSSKHAPCASVGRWVHLN